MEIRWVPRPRLPDKRHTLRVQGEMAREVIIEGNPKRCYMFITPVEGVPLRFGVRHVEVETVGRVQLQLKQLDDVNYRMRYEGVYLERAIVEVDPDEDYDWNVHWKRALAASAARGNREIDVMLVVSRVLLTLVSPDSITNRRKRRRSS